MAEKNEDHEVRPGQPQAFAPFPGPAASSGTTDPPSWAVPPARKPMRRRRGLAVTLAVVLTLVVVAGTAFITNAIGGTHGPAAASQVQNNAANQQAPPPTLQTSSQQNVVQPAPQGGIGDLRAGGVFLQSNDVVSNTVVAFARKPDGTLTEFGRYPTGGVGSGKFEDSAHGLVLGTSKGEASPTQEVDQAELVFTINAGDNTISVFRVNPNGLELVSHVPSGGNRPVSLTVNNGLLYVLNSGEVDRRLVLGPNLTLENCTTGNLPSVTGFRVTPGGELTPIENSTRLLSERSTSGCAQVSFTPDGHTLVVTERIASMTGQTKDKKGVITTFDVNYDGLLGARRLNDPSGTGPYGFNFLKDGTMIMTEQNGAMANPGGSGVVSYQINSDNSLQPINGGTVTNGRTDTCWIVVTKDQKLAFTASAFGGGAISSYRVRDDGGLELLYPVASAPDGRNVKNGLIKDGLSDVVLSRDGNFLYQLNSIDGSLWVFRVNANGLLSHMETHQVFNLAPFGQGGEAAPFGLAAW